MRKDRRPDPDKIYRDPQDISSRSNYANTPLDKHYGGGSFPGRVKNLQPAAHPAAPSASLKSPPAHCLEPAIL